MTRTISGKLDLAAYERLAKQHRPKDAESLAEVARRLRRAGHSDRYISKLLGLPLDVVTKAIEERPE
jgi:hypothetical protein